MLKIIEILSVLSNFLYILPTLLSFKPPGDGERSSLGMMLQRTAAKHGNRTAIIFEDKILTWSEFNHLSNRYAHCLKSRGVKRGDCVAVFMENRMEFLCLVIALSKIGAAASLINTSLVKKSLIHCISITDSVRCVFGEELQNAIIEIKDDLPLQDSDFLWVPDDPIKNNKPSWAEDLNSTLPQQQTENLEETRDIRGGEIALYIFTSGTTGLPKPAIIYQRRIMSAHPPYSKLGFRATASDRMYICLPLYHITGLLLGACTCFYTGSSMFLRRRFSAKHFWPEVQKYNTTLFIYVGELCRYLTVQEKCSDEKNNPIRSMLGNGLRPDIWDHFRNRFGVKRITEIYGASESNVSFLNFLNKDYTIGTGIVVTMLVEYDVDLDQIVLDDQGRPVEVADGQTGLLLGRIDDKFLYDGYKNEEASSAKVLKNVKVSGDRWFNTGDLIRRVDVGFAMGMPHYQFIDRVGDTFRWRSENVSTNEVSEILNAYPQIEMSNVYGVEIPGTEGRAGMAAITMQGNYPINLLKFTEYVDENLASYARPVFLRVQSEQKTNQTFKFVKGQLRKEAYHLGRVDQPIYVRMPNSTHYEILSEDLYQKVLDKEAGF